MPKVTLTYFEARARAELARLCLKVGGIEFDDIRLAQADWPAIKPTTPFHSLPVLNWDGEEVGQSVTIARFCAKKAGIHGKDDLEQARSDAIVDQYIDCLAGLIGIVFAKTDEAKKAKGDDMFGNKFPHFLKVVERHLQKNGGKWMVGSSLTWADLAVFNLMDNVMDSDKWTDIPGNEMRSSVPVDYPGTAELHKRVKALPAVAKWLKERPATPF